LRHNSVRPASHNVVDGKQFLDGNPTARAKIPGRVRNPECAWNTEHALDFIDANPIAARKGLVSRIKPRHG
jgi:hypothetical protein